MEFLINIIVGLILIKLFHMVLKRKPDSRWRKVGKYFLLFLLGIGVITVISISYLKYQELPVKINSLKDVTLGDSKSDVIFKIGKIELWTDRALRKLDEERKNIKTGSELIEFQKKEKTILSKIEEIKNKNEDDYVPVDENMGLIQIDFINNRVSNVVYICDDSLDFSGINGISCGSPSELIKEKYGNDVRVLCSKTGEDTERTYDIPKYNVRYYLTTNKVSGLYVGHPKEGINWIKCK